MTAVSIIIPSYRQPQFLGRAIESCLEQDHEDLEIIVIDDRSRDASLAIALSYAFRDERIRVFEAEENGGLGKARNLGLARSTGEYLCFLDSDDYLLPGSITSRLEALPAAVEAHGHRLAGVYGDWQHVGEDINEVVPRAARADMAIVSSENYTGENVFICSAPLVRRDLVMAAGGFPEGLPMLEDFSLWARMIARGAVFAPVDSVVATYRQRPNSMLRGDGVVVMADYVGIINDWVRGNGVELSDGGALGAWLEGKPPHPHGRMSWNVPSVLGNVGPAAGAEAVAPGADSQPTSSSEIADFMAMPTTTGLTATAVEVAPAADRESVSVVVGDQQQALEAIAIHDRLRVDGESVAAVVNDPSHWQSWWPLALAGIVPQAWPLPRDGDEEVIDLSSSNHRFAHLQELHAEGAALVLGSAPQRAGSIVYVPQAVGGYPAIDAWISVALHALAEAELDPVLVADPEVASELGGWRAAYLSVDDLRRSELVVTIGDASTRFAQAFAPVIRFDPTVADESAVKTAQQLRVAIGRGRR